MAQPAEQSSKARSLTKTISWRIIATGITWIVVFLFTDQLAETTYISLAAAAVLMVAYYAHERIWNNVR